MQLQEVENFEISEAEFRMPISNYTKIKGEWVMHSSVCARHGIKNIFSIEHNYSLPEAIIGSHGFRSALSNHHFGSSLSLISVYAVK